MKNLKLNTYLKKVKFYPLSYLTFLALIVLFSGCGMFKDTIRNVYVFESASPNTGPVEVRVTPQTSYGKLLFEETIIKNQYGGLPTKKFLEVIKEEGAKLGANVLIFQCAAIGSVGQGSCMVRGYSE